MQLYYAPEQALRRVDLARTVLLTASGITRLLDGLERCGWVEKKACSSDARVSYAALTPAGLAKFESASTSHRADIEELFGSNFSPAERQAARRAPRAGSRSPRRRGLLGMSPAFSSIDELGDGYGFRKVRAPLGVTAFGVNALVYPPGFDGFLHYHDTQDELYFVHRGKVLVEVEGETRELAEGGLFHCEATTPRKLSNPFDEDAVVFIVGGKDGYVERDGHMVDPDDVARRAAFGKS